MPSLWRCHSSKVYISRHLEWISLWRTKRMSAPSGIWLFRPDGKTTRPLSSTFEEYVPINDIITSLPCFKPVQAFAFLPGMLALPGLFHAWLQSYENFSTLLHFLTFFSTKLSTPSIFPSFRALPCLLSRGPAIKTPELWQVPFKNRPPAIKTPKIWQVPYGGYVCFCGRSLRVPPCRGRIRAEAQLPGMGPHRALAVGCPLLGCKVDGMLQAGPCPAQGSRTPPHKAHSIPVIFAQSLTALPTNISQRKVYAPDEQ